MGKISVIVPVYNSEAYIRQCIASLTGQTYQDWEALVIDDGSTDRSPELCEELSRADSRIKVYHQENQGVSAARNRGLDLAAGEYVAFLDSDDAIHPLLFEEMVRQMEEHHVEMAFCNLARMDDRQVEAALEQASPRDERPVWKIADGAEAERWFHIDYASVLHGVSGMMSRALIGPLRFDRELPYGEDSMFKYELFSRRVRAAYSPWQWYYYRMNPQSISHSLHITTGDAYSEQAIRIRDREYRNGHLEYAVVWESYLTAQLRKRYEVCRELGDRERAAQVKASAARECGHPLFQSVDLMHKSLFHLCFRCYPLYFPIGKAATLVWELMEQYKKHKNRG